MAEITLYDKFKYIKSDLQFYNSEKGEYEHLHGGKGLFTFSRPFTVAISFLKSSAKPSDYGTKYNSWSVKKIDYNGEERTNLLNLRKIGDYPTSSRHPAKLRLYTTNNTGFYINLTRVEEVSYGNYYYYDYGLFKDANEFFLRDGIGFKETNSTKFLYANFCLGIRDDNCLFYVNVYENIYRDTNADMVMSDATILGASSDKALKIKQILLPFITDTYNPYEDGGESEDGGGDGDFDNTSEDIEVPSLPTLSATASGFVNIFAPTLSQLNELASYMWSSDFYDNIVKLWADPMNVILGLSIVPVNVPVDDVREVKCGNVSSGVSMYHASTQFVVLDCGTINVNEYWGAYLDYSPYTKIQLYLPYCGTHSLDIDDIMGRSINVTYHIDVLSGSCVAFVKSSGKGINSVLYEFSGNVSTQIPVTGENFSRLIQTAISSVASLGSTVATGGLSAPMAITTMGSLANNVSNSKPEIERSGSMSGSTGLMGIQKPYLILTRPKQCIPKDVQKFKGFPSMKFQKLSDVKGFTIVAEILLKNITASDKEIDEIKRLLKEGVIL